MPFDEQIEILQNTKVNAKYYRLAFRSKKIARGVLPGQFLMLQIESSRDPFLRRPFSYYRVQNDRVEILYEILGKGTGILARKKAGDFIQVMAPLGKSFSLKLPRNKKRILVAGGVGVPPLVFLAEKFPTEYLLVGVKSKDEVLPRKELSKIKSKVLYSSNDGSVGAHGFVTVLLEKILKTASPENLFIQTCGPTPMMEAVMRLALKYDAEGEMSIDKTMACGVGACLGCMVKTHKGWKTSCLEGPVFNFKDLDLSNGL